MILENLVKPDSVLCNVSVRSKKHALEILSELLTRSNPDIPSDEVFAKLVERERLGCTGLDKGIAFPHCRVGRLKKSCAALMRLLEPVDFDANDGESVDLVFGLMVPAELEATDYADINLLTELLRDEAVRARLRSANSSSDLYAALFAGQHAPAAELQGARS